jgi:hypothetical protein
MRGLCCCRTHWYMTAAPVETIFSAKKKVLLRLYTGHCRSPKFSQGAREGTAKL